MGRVQRGDVLLAEDGQPCRVTSATPVQRGNPCFRVDFDDGSSIVADADHQWLTWDKAARKSEGRHKGPASPTPNPRPQNTRRHYPRVRTTTEIADTLRAGSKNEVNHSIPNAAPLDLPEARLEVDPYVLGIWLGDGHAGSATVTVGQDDLAEVSWQLFARGCDIGAPWPSSAAHTFTMDVRAKRHRADTLNGRLKAMGLLNNKHIPSEYLRASITQRTELLMGLMDSDGYCAPGGRVEFTNTNHDLARGVWELAISLGFKASIREGRATLRGRDCGPKWRVAWTPHIPVFKLGRKLARQHGGRQQRTRTRHRHIVDVQPVESVPVKCIQVDSPSSLFLAGETMVPTHNSWQIGWALVLQAMHTPRRIVILREWQYTLRDSAKRVIEDMIFRLGVEEYFDILESAIYCANGSEFLFRGIAGNQRHSIRSLEGADTVWVEEAQYIREKEMESLLPTIRAEGTNWYWSFNPRFSSDPVYQMFCGGVPPEKSLVLEKHYMDNPQMPEVLHEQRRQVARDKPEAYGHIWLGQLDTDPSARLVLTRDALQKCVGAAEKIGYTPTGRVIAGFDVSDGGLDNSAVAIRIDSLVVLAEQWSQPFDESCMRAHRICSDNPVNSMYYDATGMGTGVPAALKHLALERQYVLRDIEFGWKVAGPDRVYAESWSNADYFANRYAQLAWSLRLRAENTAKLLDGNRNIDPNRCLFIDEKAYAPIDMLLAVLAQPIWGDDATGRIRITKSPEGQTSPDLFDAMALAFALDSNEGLTINLD